MLPVNPGRLSILNRFELPLFIGVVLVHVCALYSLPALVSLDGPGHLYTARLLQALARGEEWIAPYFVFNTFPCPNGLGDYLLSFFIGWADPVRIEIYFLIVYFLLFVTGFRRLMCGFFPDQKGYAWLAFPLVFHVVLVLGFHNFNLGIALLWWTLAAYIRYAQQPNWKRSIVLLLLSLLLYFSHLVVFGVFGFFVMAHFAVSWWENKTAPWFWKKTVIVQLMVAFLPVFALALAYFNYETESSGYVHLSSTEILKLLYLGKPFELFSHKEGSYYYQMMGVLLICATVSFFWKKQREAFSTWLSVMILFAILLFIATLLLPDHSTGGGELTRRLAYFTLVAVFISLFFTIRSATWRSVAVIAIFLVHVARSQFLFHRETINAVHINEMSKLYDLVQENEIMWTFNWSGNWLLNHTSKYIAAQKSLIMPDHLGGTKLYTPVMWKDPYRLNQQVWCLNFEQWLCDLEKTEQDFHREVRYFMAIGECTEQSIGRDKCEAWRLFLSDSCQLIGQAENGYIRLYERK
ncbi:MAG: hypothetical protein RLZZ77_2208 [Bacteroidota bacterium]